MKIRHHLLVWACCLVGGNFAGSTARAISPLEEAFHSPPESAKPWTWWHWLEGNISKSGITADLESMKRVGIGGAFNFHVGQLPIPGEVKYLSPEWWDLMRFSAEEASRLGLQLGFHNSPGWSSSGGPWIGPEDSMQKVVWTETKIVGPIKADQILPQAKVDPKWNYYKDIAVLALPDSVNPIDPVDPAKVLDLSDKMDAKGHLNWDVPAGNWVVLRFGHTTTGRGPSPAPPGGEGLECDKLTKNGVEKHFQAYPQKILDNAGAASKAITTIEIDSYEVGDQNWSSTFRDEYKSRRGYDPLLWLPVLAKHTLGSKEQSDRFNWDMKRTIADLFAENYYGHFAELVHKNPGVLFAVEPYTGPFDTLKVGATGDTVMSEFWEKPGTWGWDTLKPVASVAHTHGKTLVAAESFTGLPNQAQWRQDPYALKSTGDRAFCLGVNRLVLHTYAHQPWPNVKPGMTMGFWGTHFGRTQTWWDQSTSWFDYLARCQYLLQQGQFVGDVLLLNNGNGKMPAGYDCDGCSEDLFLNGLAVKDGRLVLPCRQSYRVLVLPSGTKMLPAVAKKLRELVSAGAVVVGPKPADSPSLQGFPAADDQVRAIADELWDSGKISDKRPLQELLAGLGVVPDFATSAQDVMWTHRRSDSADIYFVSNQKEAEQTIECSFRVAGKQPELWDAATGDTRDASAFTIENGITRLPLKLDPSGSVFVIFRRAIDVAQGAAKSNWPEFARVQEVAGPWTVHFDPKWGGPQTVQFPELTDWSKNEAKGIKYYSGTATYENTFNIPADQVGKPLWIDLGNVKNLATVELNGKSLGVLWKPPFRVALGSAAQTGENKLVLKVTNLWPNRMIGDEQEPDDCEWDKPSMWKYAGKTPISVGTPLKTVPDWLLHGTPRPSAGRFTATSWKFYTKDSPLLESGLLGPVQVMVMTPAGN